MIDCIPDPSSKILDGHDDHHNVDENPALFHYQRVDAKDGLMGAGAAHHARGHCTAKGNSTTGKFSSRCWTAKRKKRAPKILCPDKTAEYYELPNSLTVIGEMADMEAVLKTL